MQNSKINPPIVFDPLSEKQSLSQTMFLEASAGTGKTFAIEHIVCRLILEGLSLDEILITTFTRKGARDLKQRIEANLRKTIKALQNGSIPYLNTLENPIRAYFSINRALQLIDDAQIHTIHSFCHKMLSEFAFEAKIDLHVTQLDDDLASNEFTLAILDTLRSLYDENEFSPAQMVRLFSPFNRDINKYQKKMSRLLESDPILPNLDHYSILLQKFSQTVDTFTKDHLIEALYTSLPSYKRACNKKGDIHPFLEEQIHDLTNKNFEKLIEASPSIAQIINKKNLKLSAKTAIPSELETLFTIIEEASNPTILFLRMAKKVQKKMREKKVENPNALLETMFEKLKIPKFYHNVQNKYKACIIDEFQDTDPLQWKIFQSLFFKTSKLFLVVGDPKQSIYAFRGANLPTYLSVKNHFPIISALSTNYRSNKDLIGKLNCIFDETFSPGLFTFEKNPNLSYQKISSGKINQAPLFDTSLQFVFFEGTKDRSKIWPTIKLEGEKIFPFIAQEINKLNSLNSVAILVKDRYQAARISDFLNAHNILNITNATSSLIETKMFSLLDLAFHLALAPRNTNLLKQFLAHPYVNWPLDKLKIGLEDSDIQKIVTIFVTLKNQLKEGGVAPFLRDFLNSAFLTSPLINNLVQDHEAYSDLQQLIKILLEGSYDSISSYLSKLKELDPEKNLHLKRKVLVEGDAVNILTSHMSKGLEFDVVFALGVASRSKERPDFIKVEDGSQHLFAEENAFCQKAMLELDKEKIRLLYVSFTRAKEKLFAFAPINCDKKTLSIGSASPMELFLTRLGKPFISYKKTYENIPDLSTIELQKILSDVNISTELVSENIIPSSLEKPFLPNLIPPLKLPSTPTSTSYLSFSSLPHTHTPLLLPEDPTILPPGSETGNIFHLIFEKMIEVGSYYHWKDDYIKKYIKKELEYTHLKPHFEEVFNLVKTAFFTPLDSFALKDVSPEKMGQEVLFLYPFQNSIMKGFADLIFSMNGKFYILDWKLNRLPSYDPTAINTAMENNNYYTQASIYRKALQNFLEHTNDTPFETLFGGTFYFFLRGKEKGLLHFFPEPLETKKL